jgi:hypothetical protein
MLSFSRRDSRPSFVKAVDAANAVGAFNASKRRVRMDCRVKPGNDEMEMFARKTGTARRRFVNHRAQLLIGTIIR